MWCYRLLSFICSEIETDSYEGVNTARSVSYGSGGNLHRGRGPSQSRVCLPLNHSLSFYEHLFLSLLTILVLEAGAYPLNHFPSFLYSHYLELSDYCAGMHNYN